MNKIMLSEPFLGKSEIDAVTKSIKDNWVSTAGKNISVFEDKISNYTKSKYCIACNSGTSALHIALKVIGIKKNDEVLAPSITFIATINSIKYNNAHPIFMDVDNFYNIDEEKTIEFLKYNTFSKNGKCYNSKTKRVIKAIIVAHIWGGGAKIKKLLNECKKKKIRIIEDAAEGLSTFYKKKYLNNKHVGTIGDLGVLSFNGNKIITTGGGGMILTDKKILAKKSRYLINQAKDNDFFLHNEVGYNYRMPNLNASLGVSQLNNINKIRKLKKNIFENYCKIFEKSKPFKIFQYSKIANPNYWMVILILKEKVNKKFINYLLKRTERQIQFRKIWLPNERQKMYKNNQKYKIKNSKILHENSICSPCSSNINYKKIKYIFNTIEKNYENFTNLK